jgi:hypothetical protein
VRFSDPRYHALAATGARLFGDSVKVIRRAPDFERQHRLSNCMARPFRILGSDRAGMCGGKRLLFVLAGALLLSIALPCRAVAHDIPVDVLVQTFLKPEGRRLHVVLRVPLVAMRDVKYPPLGQPGVLDVARADPVLRDAATLWIADYIELYEGGRRLSYPEVVAVRASQPDRAFESYDTALAEVTGPRLPDDVGLLWSQGVLDVLFDYTIESDRSDFTIHPGVARLAVRVLTVLRFLPPDGTVHAFQFQGDPGLVRLNPRWYHAAVWFLGSGFRYVLDRTDLLLYLFCLVLPFRRVRSLAPVVAACAFAPSITLGASAGGLAPDTLWFPPFIDTIVAISILYMAFENILSGELLLRRRWIVTFGFGLAYGFGFWFVLQQNRQYAGGHSLVSLLSFDAGIVAATALVVALMLVIVETAFRFAVAERLGTVIVSAFAAHSGWHWMIERGDRLRQYQFVLPVFDAALLSIVLRWLMLIVFFTGAAWLVFGVLRRPTTPDGKRQTRMGAEE